MILSFASKLAARLNEYKTLCGFTYFSHYEITVSEGKKYTKVFSVEVGANGSKGANRIVCFIDNQTGDIFKPASFSAPAKHARGNVNSPQNGMEAITPDGFVYYLKN